MKAFDDLWAKSPPDGRTRGEPLAEHILSVWDNLRLLQHRAVGLSTHVGAERLWVRAGLAVLLHDVGKACDDFQRMLRGERKFGHRHEVLSLCFLPWVLGEDPHGDLPWVAAAIVSHHKDLSEITRLYRQPDTYLGIPDGLEDLTDQLQPTFYQRASSFLAEELWPRLRSRGCELPESVALAFDRGWDRRHEGIPPLRQTLNAALALGRSLQGQRATTMANLEGCYLRGLVVLADHAGSAHVRFRTAPVFQSVQRMMSALELASDQLYPHQEHVAHCEGNVLLNAPTGSGKTEAALLWAASIGSRSKGRPVFFYLLPFQASLNAMRRRLGNIVGDEGVALQHSKAAEALYRQLLEREYNPSRAAAIAKREVALAKLHASPVRLLTPYQLLRGAFQLKGHEALWTDAAGSLLVFDEVHAYEPVRLGMILATLRHLCCELGAKALVMSATLPGRLVRLVQEAIPACKRVIADPITLTRFTRHCVRIEKEDLLSEWATEQILRHAHDGQSVLVVATTVGRAQALWARLSSHLGVGVELLHGRFHAEDRFRKETHLLHRMGSRAREVQTACVLVATQVVEVSLDVDFDVLYSDPAPIEALLQRFGRVNRRRKTPLRDVHIMASIPEGCPVYTRHLVESALRLLEQVKDEPLQEAAIQNLVDSAYEGHAGDQWEEELQSEMQHFTEHVLYSAHPFESDEQVADQFDELFDGYEVLPTCLEAEHQRREEEDPLTATSLLVPITRGQYCGLRRKGLVAWRRGTCIVDRPYSATVGLEIAHQPADDGV